MKLPPEIGVSERRLIEKVQSACEDSANNRPTKEGCCLEELALVPPERRVGPLIVSEATGEPYKGQMFTRTWRKVANAAGIPREVQNRDARPGAITERRKVGVPIDDSMKTAGHTSKQTHERIYNRAAMVRARAC
jgi:integrase